MLKQKNQHRLLQLFVELGHPESLVYGHNHRHHPHDDHARHHLAPAATGISGRADVRTSQVSPRRLQQAQAARAKRGATTAAGIDQLRADISDMREDSMAAAEVKALLERQPWPTVKAS